MRQRLHFQPGRANAFWPASGRRLQIERSRPNLAGDYQARHGRIRDLAVDVKDNRVYVAAEEHVKCFVDGAWTTLDTPKDQYDAVHVYSVAVDPADNNIVYAGGPANLYSCNTTVIRSKDAGKTWENLTKLDPPKDFREAGGPHEVQWLRVHPRMRELWVNGECYGMWKLENTSKP